MKDYINFIYGDYTILEYLGKQTWSAVCNKCGKERTYKTPNIKPMRANAGQCKCSQSGIEIGQRFGRLVVIKRDFEQEGKERSIYWLCQCDCGNSCSTTTKRLKNGTTRSCGCLNDDARKERIVQWNEEHAPNMIGQESGLLTVVRPALPEEVEGRPKGVGYWFCRCQCGNHHIVGTNDFTRGKVQSCGCLNSKGEAKITSILMENNILFTKQYSFKDLIGEQGRHYFFDFAILNDDGTVFYLVEFDGIQHYSALHQFSQDPRAFKTIQKRDEVKNNYAFSHNIPLIRIPYTHFDNLTINDLQLETTKFLVKKESDE